MGEFLSVFLDTRIETGLQAGAAVLLVAFCSRVLLRNRRKRFCCALWMLVFIRFLCPLTLPVPAGMLADRAGSAAAWRQALTEKLWGQADRTAEMEYLPGGQAVSVGEAPGQPDGTLGLSGEVSGQPGGTSSLLEGQSAQSEEASGQPGGTDPSEAWNPADTGSAVDAEGPFGYAVRAAFGAVPPRKLFVGLVWLSGIIGLSAVSLFRYRRIRKRLCTAVRVPAGAYEARTGRSFGGFSVTDQDLAGEQEVRESDGIVGVRGIRKSSGFAGVREIRESDRIAGPFVLGVFRPVIYLPAGLAEEERACVLAHEAAHIRRKDHLVKLVCFLAAVLNWMNPLAWIAFRLMGQDMETACDELALEGAGNDVCIRYSKTLLRTAARQSRLPVPLFFGEGNTKRRVKNVLQIGGKKPVGPLLAAALAATVAVGIFIGVSPRQEGPEEAGTLSGRAEETAASGEDAERAGQSGDSALSASPEGPGTGSYADGLEIASYAAAPGEQKDMILNGVNVTQQYRDAEENFEALQERLAQIRTEQEEIQRRVERLGEAAEEATEEERQEKIRAYRDVLQEQTEKENALMEAEKQLAAERARLRQLVITLGKGYDLVAKRREELESLPAELTPEQLDKRGIYMEEDPKTRERLQEFADLTEYRGALQDEDGASWAWLDDTQITETVPGEWDRSEKKITAMTIRLGSRAEDGSLTVCSVTALGDGYLVLTDRSRDKGLEEGADPVTEEYYGFLNWFSEEDGEYVIASDDPSVTMQELFDSQLSSRYGAAIPYVRIASLPAKTEEPSE